MPERSLRAELSAGPFRSPLTTAMPERSLRAELSAEARSRFPDADEARIWLRGAPETCVCESCQLARQWLESSARPVQVSTDELRSLSYVLRGSDISNIITDEVARPNPILNAALTPSEDDAPTQESRAYIPRAVRNDWRTPDNVLEVVRRALGGEIYLDPCGSTERWLAGEDEIGILNFHEEDDGLTLNWVDSIIADGGDTAERTVYVNPPFNRNKDWVTKCAEEAARGAEVVLLIPARVDTRYWQNTIAHSASAICFWRGRIRFVGASAGAPFPCALVYWGPNEERFVSTLRSAGHHAFINGQRIAAPEVAE